MGILVAIVVVALIVAVVVLVMRRRPARRPVDGDPASPLARRGWGARRSDPMAAAVAEHARATDPEDVLVAEQRLRERARQVAAPLKAEATRTERQRAADQSADPGYAGPPTDVRGGDLG
jgi:hypothetical protein